MKKKTMIVIALLLFICLAFLYFNYIYGWMEFRKNTSTPKKFLNNSIIQKENYLEDSIEIRRQLKIYLNKHENSFYNKEYSDSTQLFIDTILYSPDYTKIATFIIVKTPISRRKNATAQDKLYNYWYDAFCYIGKRQKDTFNLKWVRRFYPINWYDKNEISRVIRNDYFTEFSTLKDTAGAYQYKYNLNDKRFWECPVWDEYYCSRYDSLP